MPSPVMLEDALLRRTTTRPNFVPGGPLVIRPLAAVASLFVLAAPLESQGENWPSFRGHRAQGIAEGHETPLTWNVGAGEGVLWSTPIPGLAHSAPVVFGDRLFVTTAVRLKEEAKLSSLYGSDGYGAGESVLDEGPHAFRLLCLDKRTGALLWERTAYEGVPEVKRHPKSSHANPTPSVDASRVVAFFGSEGLFVYDHEGELKWQRDFGVLDAGAPRDTAPPGLEGFDPSDYQWGFASSPILHEEKLLVQCDVQDQSFVAALDADTGKELWRTDRDEGPTWCTPTVYEVEGEARLVLNGYRHIGGYDLETGKELWKRSGGGDVPVPTPVVMHDLIYLTSAHGPLAPLYAIDAAAATGELGDDSEAILWYHPRRGIYMQTPLVYGYEVYACSDGGVLGCFDAGTGELHYRERLGDGTTGFSASAVAADGKLYFTGESGEVHVVRAGTGFEVLAVNDLGETCMATPAISEGVIFFRTVGRVVAVGTEKADEE